MFDCATELHSGRILVTSWLLRQSETRFHSKKDKNSGQSAFCRRPGLPPATQDIKQHTDLQPLHSGQTRNNKALSELYQTKRRVWRNPSELMSTTNAYSSVICLTTNTHCSQCLPNCLHDTHLWYLFVPKIYRSLQQVEYPI